MFLRLPHCILTNIDRELKAASIPSSFSAVLALKSMTPSLKFLLII